MGIFDNIAYIDSIRPTTKLFVVPLKNPDEYKGENVKFFEFRRKIKKLKTKEDHEAEVDYYNYFVVSTQALFSIGIEMSLCTHFFLYSLFSGQILIILNSIVYYMLSMVTLFGLVIQLGQTRNFKYNFHLTAMKFSMFVYCLIMWIVVMINKSDSEQYTCKGGVVSDVVGIDDYYNCEELIDIRMFLFTMLVVDIFVAFYCYWSFGEKCREVEFARAKRWLAKIDTPPTIEELVKNHTSVLKA